MAAITPAVLTALWSGAKKNFNTGFEAMDANSVYRDICAIVTSEDAKETYDWLGEFPEMVEWIGDRVISDIKAFGYEIANQSFANGVAIKRTDIQDDKLGTYAPRFTRLGEQAARKPDYMTADLIKAGETALCYDGQYFFDTDHPVYANHDGTGAVTATSNLIAGGGQPWYLLDLSSTVARPFIFQERQKVDLVLQDNMATSTELFMRNNYVMGCDARWAAGYGFWQQAVCSKAALDGDSLDAAFDLMASFQGDGGRQLGITPTHLLVGRSNRAAANKTVKVMLGAGGASNANYEQVEVIYHPLLP